MVEEVSVQDVDFTEYCILESNDPTPVKFKVRREAAMMSGLLKDMLEDQNGGDPIIPIPNVSARTLKLVIKYMEHHHKERADPIEKPLKSNIEKIISPWDHDFLYTELVKDHDEKQHEVLIDVIMAANFLNVRDLLDLTCACVANMIRGKSAEQIRELFNIESDFTPEEEEKIREENRWCEEA
ncbi:Cyclin A/CDK2-associated protein [Trypanosoma brucei gambiense DAL972]|uniref:S-phase kinase-associated protein, putative n=2 Tax=Trypanosoma brucei TaxID=5691 RepID=D0A7C2_TRYB9|nr:Cyclin A/CDK2-associated protein [Trypanosoma brucei gambiense DAL972]RHW67258.1 SKP1-like protein [Trypanosoma brucei equiperdum]CBH17573.1 Cyclin A/CDK2-associated protein [Trypanosoma brucei gambiense DAL972]|eukprot:XP_011779837.1 Cyclin A/CDK2-associated protein [Trypanosoma brucei gambiense DAL972]